MPNSQVNPCNSEFASIQKHKTSQFQHTAFDTLTIIFERSKMKLLNIASLTMLLLLTSAEARSHHSYGRGYQDGCDTARNSFLRDNYAFRYNPDYRNGWIEGERACQMRPPMNTQRYEMGYEDGCTTARYQFRKNMILWATSNNYRRGWRDGTMCR